MSIPLQRAVGLRFLGRRPRTDYALKGRTPHISRPQAPYPNPPTRVCPRGRATVCSQGAVWLATPEDEAGAVRGAEIRAGPTSESLGCAQGPGTTGTGSASLARGPAVSEVVAGREREGQLSATALVWGLGEPGAFPRSPCAPPEAKPAPISRLLVM